MATCAATQSLQFNKHDHQTQETYNINSLITMPTGKPDRKCVMKLIPSELGMSGWSGLLMYRFFKANGHLGLIFFVKWSLIIIAMSTKWNSLSRFSGMYVTGRQLDERNNSTGYLRDGIQNKWKQTDVTLSELKNPNWETD